MIHREFLSAGDHARMPARSDGFFRIAHFIVRSRFDFDEMRMTILLGDDVDLPAFGAGLDGKDGKPGRLITFRCQGFSNVADGFIVSAHVVDYTTVKKGKIEHRDNIHAPEEK